MGEQVRRHAEQSLQLGRRGLAQQQRVDDREPAGIAERGMDVPPDAATRFSLSSH